MRHSTNFLSSVIMISNYLPNFTDLNFFTSRLSSREAETSRSTLIYKSTFIQYSLANPDSTGLNPVRISENLDEMEKPKNARNICFRWAWVFKLLYLFKRKIAKDKQTLL